MAKHEQQDLQERLAAARKAAKEREPVDDAGRDWPDPDDVDLPEALTLLGIEAFLNGAKIAAGITADGQSLWFRLGYPKWSARRDLQGMSAMTFSSDLDRGFRKLAQLPAGSAHANFKPDPYAK
jgi:hypothetical protein